MHQRTSVASDRVVPAQLRQAIAEALANNVKAYSLEDACVALGLPPARDGENPFDSKRVYVNTRLEGRAMPSLVEIARGVVEQYGDETLESLLSRVGPHGVDGELKNLIFAANGPKPRIVLRDSLNNVIEIVQNQEYCLVYDDALIAWTYMEGSRPVGGIASHRSTAAREELAPSTSAWRSRLRMIPSGCCSERTASAMPMGT
ncbi:MAG TPA: hypothetical protein VKB03_15190 [Conexibacter sp.]|nr:hypothetical protein [Conexibacter sp.]